jgi:hypothetical protein
VLRGAGEGSRALSLAGLIEVSEAICEVMDEAGDAPITE